MAELTVIEQNGQRVLTTQQIAEVFETDVERIQVNFNRNKDRFEQGKHYFLLEGEELRRFKTAYQNDNQLMKHARAILLITERGARMLAKTINTQRAWDAYEEVVDSYYDVKQSNTPVQTIPMDQSLPTIFRATANLYESQEKLKHIIAEHDSEIKELREVVEKHMTLDYAEQRHLQRAIGRRVYEFSAEREERDSNFREIHREIKDRWGVASYKDIPRTELGNVLKYVDAWRPRVMVVV